MPLPPQHGVKGVYYGGKWLDLEECDGVFSGIEDKCSGCRNPNPCPRSRSTNQASDDGIHYDVCIIGAGCIGAAIARELSKFSLKVCWLEAADDVSQGATKGNSGIVHAGYDDKPGTNRAKFCWKGNQMFPRLDRELRFGYQLNGSMVLAMKEDDRKELQNLLERGKVNGVERLQILEKDEVLQREPYVNRNVVAALYSPDAGNVIPYEYTIALAENAVDNGVELRIRRHVAAINTTASSDYMEITVDHWEPKAYIESMKNGFDLTTLGAFGGVLSIMAFVSGQITKPYLFITLVVAIGGGFVLQFFFPDASRKRVKKTTPLKDLVEKAGPITGTGGTKVSVDDMKVGGSGSNTIVGGVIAGQETVRARFVINCAGSASDAIANMIGDKSFKIKPRLGDYLLLNRNQGHLARHTLFPCPDPVLGKGVLVQTTLWGNLILGPTARDMHEKEASGMTAKDIQHYILSKCSELVPRFDAAETIHAFCGARAKSDRGDWIIENSSVDGRMIHVAGIDSPGLAGSPAIAVEVVRLLEESGCALKKNPSFNPQRAPIIDPKPGGMGKLKLGPVGKNDSDGINEEAMAQNVICKCERVTELEVVRALRRSLPIDSTQAIRKRTRAGMGHCQGDPENYNCEARVKAIIARETGLPIELVGGRPWPATSTLSQRWPDGKELQELERMKE